MNGSVIERYLPFYQLGYADRLKEWQRELLWEVVDRVVKNREKRHFKVLYQTNEDFHQDRVMAFFEIALTNYNKSPGWVCHVFTQAFSQIEALLQMRRMGVALPSSSIMEFRKSIVISFVEYFSYKRSGKNWYDWYRWYKGKHATHSNYCSWWDKADHLITVLMVAPVTSVPWYFENDNVSNFFSNESL